MFVLIRSCRIESMKMETVIRSPQKGVVAKLVHKAGVS
jgi:3-methylcrotonyl-CoA carboxylase alpha subunit